LEGEKEVGMKECEACGKEVETLHELLLNNDEGQMVCEKCLQQAESIGDMEYERQREEDMNEHKIL